MSDLLNMSPYFALHDPLNFLSLCVATDQVGHRPTSLLKFLDPTQTYTPDGTPLNERTIRRRGHHLHNTQQTNIYALRWIWSRDPSIQAAADLRLRPHRHLDRSINISHVFPRYITCPHLESHNISTLITKKLCAPLHSTAISDKILHYTVERLELILVINELNARILDLY